MRYRTLGRTGYKVSEIGFGAWGIGGGWWKGEQDQESLQSLRRALELGVNFLDTAITYGDGHSEELVGQVVRESKSKVYVTTKIPPKNYGFPPAPGTPLREAFPKEWIIACTERSLKSLGLEQIDLQQFHVWSDEWADMDEWKEAVVELKRQGKISAFGLSLNYPLERDYGAKAINTGLIDACEVTYNIYEQEPEEGLFPLALEKNIGILAKSPLDEGSLSGKITPESVFPEGGFLDGYFRGDRRQEVWKRAQALEFLKHDPKDSLAEIALRFCLSHPAVTSVIAGMRKPEHVDSNAAASDKGPLPKKDLEQLKGHAWPHNFWI